MTNKTRLYTQASQSTDMFTFVFLPRRAPLAHLSDLSGLPLEQTTRLLFFFFHFVVIAAVRFRLLFPIYLVPAGMTNKKTGFAPRHPKL